MQAAAEVPLNSMPPASSTESIAHMNRGMAGEAWAHKHKGIICAAVCLQRRTQPPATQPHVPGDSLSCLPGDIVEYRCHHDNSPGASRATQTCSCGTSLVRPQMRLRASS